MCKPNKNKPKAKRKYRTDLKKKKNGYVFVLTPAPLVCLTFTPHCFIVGSLIFSCFRFSFNQADRAKFRRGFLAMRNASSKFLKGGLEEWRKAKERGNEGELSVGRTLFSRNIWEKFLLFKPSSEVSPTVLTIAPLM